jgi:hypothetical protein
VIRAALAIREAFPEHVWQSAGRIIYRINVNFSDAWDCRRRNATTCGRPEVYEAGEKQDHLQSRKYSLRRSMSIRTQDAEALTAVDRFLRFKIQDQQTGDSLEVQNSSGRTFATDIFHSYRRNSLHRKWFRMATVLIE